jgi:hypothetical protein
MKISWADGVRNEVLQTANGQMNTITRKTADWISHILRANCLIRHAIEGKIKGRIEVTEDDDKNVSSYWMNLRKREDIVI